MAAHLENQGHELELVEGSKGIFDVYADEKLVFSKYDVDRFPEHEEIDKVLSP